MTRRRPLTALLVAEAISLTGSRMSFLAVPWLVLEATGSAAQTGLVTFAEMLPYVLASALGGPLVDQRGPRRTSIAADTISVAVVSAVPMLYAAGLLPLGALVAVIALAGGLRGLGDIAKGALFPAVVEGSGVDLTRAAGLHDGIGRLSILLGGAAGGVLVAWMGAPNVLLVDAGSFVAAAVLIAAAVRIDPPAPPAADREPYRAALGAGLRYVRSDRLLLGIVLVVLATNLLDQAYLGVFIPVWVHDVLESPSALGVLFGAFGAGAVVGNLLFTALAPRLPRYATFGICFVLSGGPQYLVLAFTGSLAVAATTLAVGGILCGAINPILSSVVYERVPVALRARVLGVLRATAWAGVPIGGLVGGLLVGWFGLTAALAGVGTVYLMVSAVPLLARSWREIERGPTMTSQVSATLPDRRYRPGRDEHHRPGGPRRRAVAGMAAAPAPQPARPGPRRRGVDPSPELRGDRPVQAEP